MKRSIGEVATRAIMAGKTTKQVIAAVLEAYPSSKTNASSVGWYRRKLRLEGHKVPTKTTVGRPVKVKR